MSTRRGSSKSFIDKLSARLQRLEVDRAIAAETSDQVIIIDPQVLEIQVRYAKYKQEKAEKWKRLGREPTYQESWAELTFQQFRNCLKYTPEERYQSRKRDYAHGKGFTRGLGCNQLTGCVSAECRYYADNGRVEDEEAIEDLEIGKGRLAPSCQLSVRLHSTNGRCCSDDEYNMALNGSG